MKYKMAGRRNKIFHVHVFSRIKVNFRDIKRNEEQELLTILNQSEQVLFFRNLEQCIILDSTAANFLGSISKEPACSISEAKRAFNLAAETMHYKRIQNVRIFHLCKTPFLTCPFVSKERKSFNRSLISWTVGDFIIILFILLNIE